MGISGGLLKKLVKYTGGYQIDFLGGNCCVNMPVSMWKFAFLDSSNNEYALKIKEELHIMWQKPELNQQVIHYNITLF